MATPPSDVVRAVQAAAAIAPLDHGAVRFTAVQAMGRGATVYEARRASGGPTRTIVDLAPGDGGIGWSVVGRDTKPLASETLDYVTGLIDSAIRAAPDPAVCADGPDYYAEHGTTGVAGGGCTVTHPNAGIARALGLAEAVQP